MHPFYLRINYSVAGGGDPFTGSSAYSTEPMDVDSDQDASEHFPQKTFLQFPQVPFHLISQPRYISYWGF